MYSRCKELCHYVILDGYTTLLFIVTINFKLHSIWFNAGQSPKTACIRGSHFLDHTIHLEDTPRGHNYLLHMLAKKRKLLFLYSRPLNQGTWFGPLSPPQLCSLLPLSTACLCVSPPEVIFWDDALSGLLLKGPGAWHVVSGEGIGWLLLYYQGGKQTVDLSQILGPQSAVLWMSSALC